MQGHKKPVWHKVSHIAETAPFLPQWTNLFSGGSKGDLYDI